MAAESGGNRPAKQGPTIVDKARIVGWLLKRPGKAHLFGMKPWQKRYVVLDCLNNTLNYFKSDDSQKPSGTIELQRIESVERGEKNTDFNVATSVEQRVYVFRCSSEEECSKWFEPLKVYGKAFRGIEGPQQCVKMKVLMSVAVKLPKSCPNAHPFAVMESDQGSKGKENPVWTELCRTETLESDSKLDKSAKRRFFVLFGATVPTDDVKFEGSELTYTAWGPDLRVVVYDSKRLKDKTDRLTDGRPLELSGAGHILSVTFTLAQLLRQPDCSLSWGFPDGDEVRKKHHDETMMRPTKVDKAPDALLEIKFEGAQECVEFSGGRVMEQSYKLPRRAGGWVLLHERLAESPFTFNVPSQLFHRTWVNECMWLKKLKTALTTKEKRLSKMKPPDDFTRMSNLLADAFGMDDGKVVPISPYTKLDDEIFVLREEIRLSRECKANLRAQKRLFQDYNASYMGLRFKPSVKKNDVIMAWIATNLHKQTFTIHLFDGDQCHRGQLTSAGVKVQMATSIQKHEQDTITVGAFAAHPLKFKHGGMSGCCTEIVDLRAQTVMYRQANTAVRQKMALKLRTKEFDLDQRKSMVWSQGLSALVSAFVAHLIRQLKDIMAQPNTTGLSNGATILLRQHEIGFLVQVESLLSTFAHERGMLEDHQYAVCRMRNTRFRCRRVTGTVQSQDALIRAEIVGVVTARPDEFSPSPVPSTASATESPPPSQPGLDRDASVDAVRLRTMPYSSIDPAAFTVAEEPPPRSRSLWLPSSPQIPAPLTEWLDSVPSVSCGCETRNASASISELETPRGLSSTQTSTSSSFSSLDTPVFVCGHVSSTSPAPAPPPEREAAPEVAPRPYLSVADAFKASTEEKVAKLTRAATLQTAAAAAAVPPRSPKSARAPPPPPLAVSPSSSDVPRVPSNIILFSELVDSYFSSKQDDDESPDEKEEVEKLDRERKKDEPRSKLQRARWMSFSGVQVRSLAGHRILDKQVYSERNTSLTGPLQQAPPPPPPSPSPPPPPSPSPGTPVTSIHLLGGMGYTPPTTKSSLSASTDSCTSSLSHSTTPSSPILPSPSRLASLASSISPSLKRDRSNVAQEVSAMASNAGVEFRPGQSDRGDLDEGSLVELLLPSFLFDVLPASLRYVDTSAAEPRELSLEFEAYPILITQGVNEQQSVADTINKSLREQQTLINRVAARNLANYASEYMKYHKEEPDCRLKSMIRAMETQAFSENNSKNLELLHEVARSVRHMGGSRIICCKSAKDRTSMSVTLDQFRLVKKAMEEDFQLKVNDIEENDLARWLQVSRLEGVRIQNTAKNTGQRGFAFNAFQRSCLPELFRPPELACGKSQPT